MKNMTVTDTLGLSFLRGFNWWKIFVIRSLLKLNLLNCQKKTFENRIDELPAKYANDVEANLRMYLIRQATHVLQSGFYERLVVIQEKPLKKISAQPLNL